MAEMINIDIKSTLNYRSLKPMKFQSKIGMELQEIYLTPKDKYIKLDFRKNWKWQYAAELGIEESKLYCNKETKQATTIKYSENNPNFSWDSSDYKCIEISKVQYSSLGNVSEIEIDKVSINGLKHQLYLRTFGDKLSVSLNHVTAKGAHRALIYALNFGPQGVCFERTYQGKLQSLQQITDAEKLPGNGTNGQLVWRTRPSFDPGYGNFTLSLD